VPRRDRPAQFAGVRTDAELNEIGEPVMWHCQPAPDSLPDPESCLLTGILPQHCLQQGLPEHAFAAAIERQLARPARWAWATTASASTTRSRASCSGAT
jgi:exodeoxyribonuclease I